MKLVHIAALRQPFHLNFFFPIRPAFGGDSNWRWWCRKIRGGASLVGRIGVVQQVQWVNKFIQVIASRFNRCLDTAQSGETYASIKPNYAVKGITNYKI